MQAEPSVELREVVKRHGSTVAVDHLSLGIRRGEFFSLLGPSGSGKTTTLRLIAGFEHPDRGDILIDGRSVTDDPPNLRPVNLVFQQYALFPHLTVSGNVDFGLEMRGAARGEIHARVGAALDMVQLAGKGDRLPAQLSGGEQQRVALARALVNRPAVLLLDEPLGALDQQLRQEMQVELKAIQEQVGLTFICVTHHQEEALTMSDRVAVMDRGRVLQVGAPQELYETPASLFVAEFVGLSNRLDGRLVEVEGTTGRIEAPELPAIRADVPAGIARGSAVALVIRPERLHLSQQAAVGGFDNVVPARVAKAVYNGHEMRYQLRVADRLLWTARVPNAEGGQKRFRSGEAAMVCWNRGESVVLPR
jgi:spermidine/putrescine transport system ATP-binding protein